jgi:hypothetical protein
MEIKFTTKNEKQLLAAEAWIDDSVDEILYGGAKGGGKSFLGCSLIFGDALIYPETHYFIARKELNDLRKFTIPTIHEVFEKWDLRIGDYAVFNGQDNCFKLYNDSKVFLISCREEPSDPFFERFGSMQMTRGWIEEGGEVPESARANLWLSIGRWKNQEYKLKKKLLITANPKKGWMKKDFVDPLKTGTLPANKRFIQALPTDNVYNSQDYLKTLSEEKDKIRRQRLWEGNWEYDEDQDSLLNFEALTDVFSNTITKDGQKYLVIDVARLGRDATIFSFWDGLECYRIDRFEKQDTEVTKQKAKDMASAERIPWSNVLIDEDGIGGAVVDGMPGVKGFIANSSPLPAASQIRERTSKFQHNLVPKPNYKNIKSQCGFKLAELINEHKLAVKVPEYRDIIIEELTSILRQKDIDSDGKNQLRPKEDVKQELGKSPDVGDTFLMRAWFELKKEAFNEDPVKMAQITRAINNQFSRNQNRVQMNDAR